MAGVTRDISTRLVMQGEKEYRAAIAGINRDMKTLDSEIKLVDSSFQGQRNTLAALEAKNKALNDVIAKQSEKLNTEKSALDNVKKLQTDYARQAAEARAKLDELARTTDDATKETDEYKAAVQKLQAEITRNETAEGKCAAAVANHTAKANQAQVKLNDLNGELSRNDKYLDEARNSTDGCAKSIDAFGKEAKEAGGDAAEMCAKGKSGIEALAGALAAAGIAKTLDEIRQAITACIEASITFESAMAGVAKTTDMSGEELAAMGDQFKEMSASIPLSAAELAKIAEVGGQLGVAKGDLTAFTEVMAKLAVATNLTSEEAATMLAQFANVTGMSLKDVDKLGSVVVALGNSFATDEKKIVTMSQRLASAGTIAGLTEQEILALATSMSSVGIEAEAGGTAMTQTLTTMGKAVDEGGDKLETFAGVAGVSSAEFAAAWKSDPIAAIQLFVSGLNRMNESGQSVGGVLDELGLDGIRQGNMLKSLALASDKLNKAVLLGNKAWQENNALNKEAATRFATTESKVKLYKNSVENLKIAVGDQLTPALGALADKGADVVQWATRFVEENRWLVPAITGVAAALGALSAGVVGVTVVVPALKAAWTALNTALTASPWMLAASAVLGLVAAIGVAVSSAKSDVGELAEAAKALPESFQAADEDYAKNLTDIEETYGKAEVLIGRLKELEGKKASAGDLSQNEWQEWNDILEILVDTVPELTEKINLQTGEIDGGTAALEKYVDGLEQMAKREAAVKALAEYYTLTAKAQVTLAEAEDKHSAAYKTYDAQQQERIRLLNELAAAGAIGSGAIDDLAGSYSTLDASQFDQSLWGTIEAYNQLTPATAKAKAESEGYYDVVTTSKDALTEAEERQARYEEILYATGGAAAGAAGGVNALTEAEQAQVDRMTAMHGELDALTKSYDAAYNAALQSINGVVNGFNAIDLSKIEKTNLKDMLAALQSQTDYMDQYITNLAKLDEMAQAKGIKDTDGYAALLRELNDGSMESMSLLQGIIDDGGVNLDLLAQKKGEVEAQKVEVATLMADMETDFSAKTQAIKDEMDSMVADINQSDAAAAAANATIQAAIKELDVGLMKIRPRAEAIRQAMASMWGSGTSISGGKKSLASHASGLDYVPYDDYYARLHKGERVLTALQAQAMDAQERLSYDYPMARQEQASAAPVAAAAPTIDYGRLGREVAEALNGVGVYMGADRVGDLVTERVSRNIQEDRWSKRV